MTRAKKRNVKWCDYFSYDETSPSCLRWKVDRHSGKNLLKVQVYADDPAGSVGEAHGYYSVTLDKTKYRVHRIIWEMFHGKISDPDSEIDHIDGSRENNRIENLREVSRAINTRNHKLQKNNSSGIVGVGMSGNGKCAVWRARWNDLTGALVSRSFAISVYGNEEAFRLACEHRAKMIEELNAQGAGYTEDHGKRVTA